MVKKQFLRGLWCKKVILLKHSNRTHGRKAAAVELRGMAYYIWKLGEVRTGRCPKGLPFAKEDQELEAWLLSS